MISWEILLSKGQEWDWLGDPFFRVQTLLIVFVLCLGSLVYRELRIANPLINFRTLLDRNFRACCIIIFCAFGVLYANTTALPALLQSLFGYDATTSGTGPLSRGTFRDHRAFDCRHAPLPWSRCTLSHRYRVARPGLRKLLDVASESGNQSVANCLAARRLHRWAFHAFRAAQCGGLSLPSEGAARRCRRFARSLAQRRRQCRHFGRPNDPGTARSIP